MSSAELVEDPSNPTQPASVNLEFVGDDDALQYLESVGATDLLHNMVQALLSLQPSLDSMATVLRNVITDAEHERRQPKLVRMESSTSESYRERKQVYFKALEERPVSGLNVRLLRQDVLTGRWLMCIQNSLGGADAKPTQYKHKGRAEKRAHEQPCHVTTCPFCKGNEALGAEVARIRDDGSLTQQEGGPPEAEDQPRWLVRALRNKFPYLANPTDPPLYETAFQGTDPSKLFPAVRGEHQNELTHPNPDNPLYPQVDGIGASEVIVESPTHNALVGISTDDQVWHTLRLLVARGRRLREHPQAFMLLYFKQYGADACGSLVHPHMQVCTLPIVNNKTLHNLNMHLQFFHRFGQCAVEKLYIEDVCREGSVAHTRLVRETEHFVASVPYAKRGKGRLVIAPRTHRLRFEDVPDEELRDLATLVRLLCAAMYRLYDDPAYTFFWETAPPERAGLHAKLGVPDPELLEQSFRWTMHIRIPGKTPGFTLSSGIDVFELIPEDVARKLRGAIEKELEEPIVMELANAAANACPPSPMVSKAVTDIAASPSSIASPIVTPAADAPDVKAAVPAPAAQQDASMSPLKPVK